MSKHLVLASLLMDLEAQLRNLALWEVNRPSAEALASEQPFCIDALSFPQWLQFIFIERLGGLLEISAALPSTCQVAPMAEEFFKGSDYSISLILSCLKAIDELLSQ
jgi:uncharacterized protein YqcC (DUF446 family)